MPVRCGGITLYPANELNVIFDWAERNSRSLEWVEGAFFDPKEDRGQLSVSYICECGSDYAAFKAQCLSLVPEIEAEAATIGLAAYFEIGISASPSSC
ncbi:hypothetical protein NX02_11410 [Sphingomonas sanxanigenens DSM 19645 = NX02]|uniref:Uncharacterized protein n=2 Tax=Sphingomonas sanxanigenens TaxID=397260 RepID=W0ACJ0_9SPHN|nr:hypothetical protein NX02_11410 [Sphingomonas sanxanigenens DSM 19645 = NX02]